MILYNEISNGETDRIPKEIVLFTILDKSNYGSSRGRNTLEVKKKNANIYLGVPLSGRAHIFVFHQSNKLSETFFIRAKYKFI